LAHRFFLGFVDRPPGGMQDPASFNLEAVKKQIEAMIKAREGQ